MNGGSKGVYVVIFIGVFLFILVIGISSEVSFGASFNRAFLAGAIFTGMVAVINLVMTNYIFPGTTDIAVSGSVEEIYSGQISDHLGNEVDFTVADSPAPPERQQSQPAAQDQADTAPEFIPLTAKQIDPNVNRIINEDPEKVAEIVRKMGFDQE